MNLPGLILNILLLLLFTSSTAFTHGGKTDANGGHNDRMNGLKQEKILADYE